MPKNPVRPTPKQQPRVSVQQPKPAPKPAGSKGGKTLVPQNLQQFTTDQLRGTGEQGRTIRELQELSKNRANPPVDRQKNPMPLPKEKNG